MADVYKWTVPIDGTFDLPSNWTDTTTPGNTGVTAPGSLDTAILAGPDVAPAQTITGPGTVTSLAIEGLNVLLGSFGAATAFVDGATAVASLDLKGSLSTSTSLVVGDAGQGTLTVESGAAVTASSPSGTFQIVVGNQTGSAGTLSLLAGGTLGLAGPTEVTDYGAIIGNHGTGDFIINGSSVSLSDSEDGIAVAYSSGSSGTLALENGAAVTFGTSNDTSLAAIAIAREGNGLLSVDGSGTTLTANGDVYIGRAGAGTLLILDHAVVDQTGTASVFEIGGGSSSNNNHVGGTGSGTIATDGTLTTAGRLDIGGNGMNGALTVGSGGQVSAGQPGTKSAIAVGFASIINGTTEGGSGTLTIDAGGTVEVSGTAIPGESGMVVGAESSSSGTVYVTGGILNTGENLVNIGDAGTGFVQVTDGGSLTAASPAVGSAAIVLGNDAGGVGTLSVSGTNSSVDALGPLTVGYQGQGTLDVESNARVTAGNVDIGYFAGAGVATVGGGAILLANGTLGLGGTASAGTLDLLGGTADSSNAFIAAGSGIDLAGGELQATGSVSDSGTISGSGLIESSVVNNAGLVMASGGVLTVADAISGTGAFEIGDASTFALDAGAASSANITFSTASGQLDISTPGSFNATVSDFVAGDTIFAQGAVSLEVSGAVLTLLSADNAEIGTIDLAAAVAPALVQDTDGTITLACFAAGTRIETERGAIAVERLAVGDAVHLSRGGLAAIVWLGYAPIDCARHPKPSSVWPVRIAAHAFGHSRPASDLWLSPDHAVLINDVLIPIRHLVNGTTIAQIPCDHVTYWHVELAAHDVLLAEGLPCESYLDTGNRSSFANGGSARALHPVFERLAWDTRACAPLAVDGDALVAAKRELIARVISCFGFRLDTDPDLRIEADGVRQPVAIYGHDCRVALPPGTRRVTILSRRWTPGEACAEATDDRVLGVALSALWIDRREVGLASPALQTGWHACENDWRWTDGSGVIDVTGAREVGFRLGMNGQYWIAPPPVETRQAVERIMFAA